MTLWTASAAAAATGGQSIGDWAVNGVSIDTRTLKKGDLFVALKAARDGHDFVAQALEKGAAAALVSRIPAGLATDAPLLLVDDVLPALEQLGIAARARTQARVVGVTGSVGKTSTKEMLRDVLSAQGKTHVAEASYNNHWGVPLTLARMPADTEFAVIEIGMNHPGEIAPLSRMARPHVALITTVAAAHLEAFENIEGIAREKASIFEGLEPDGVAIVNGDVDTAPVLRSEAAARTDYAISFGEGEQNDVILSDVQINADATQGHLALPQDIQLDLTLSVVGRHYIQNASGVMGVMQALDLDLAQAARDISRWSPFIGRGTRETVHLPAGDIQMIDDAFNANPTSLAAAIEVLAAAADIRKVAILGDMLELGSDEAAMHIGIADLPHIASIDLIHCAGPRMRALWEKLPKYQRGVWVETAQDLADHVNDLVQTGDLVLIKGSKGSKISLCVDALRKLGQSLD